MPASSPANPAGLLIHLDAVGGIAGDMFVAAMLDAVPELAGRVMADISAVLPAEIPGPLLTVGNSGALTVRRFSLPITAPAHPAGHHHHDDHHSEHRHHDAPACPVAPVRYTEMVRLISSAELAEGTADRAISILTFLADAEASIHGTVRDEVHFHEIADWDSLVDVVAAGSIAAALDGSRWSVSALPQGGGTIRTQHGLLPVPAPATTSLLRGFVWRNDGVDGERVTPTGAAILCHLAAKQDLVAGVTGRLVAQGIGAGTRELPDMPNVLRALVFDASASGTAEDVEVISFDIDDMTGEEIGIAVDIIRAADGVLDLTVGNRQGKKGRPVHDFRILARPSAVNAIIELCMLETSTIGLRRRREARSILKREAVSGWPPGKRAFRPREMTTTKTESDALRGIPTLAARRSLAPNQND